MPGLNLKRSHCTTATLLRHFSRRGPGTVSAVEQSVKAWVLGWGPAALWVAVLFLLSEVRGLSVDLPGGTDKAVHVGLYLILGLSLSWGKQRTGSGIPGLMLLLMGVGYAALDEWHQSFVPGRDAAVGDWVADGAGVMLGLVLFSSFSARFNENGSSPSRGTTTTSSR